MVNAIPMNEPSQAAQPVIVTSAQPVTLIGGGPLGPGDLRLALAHAPLLVAADGGAHAALAAGHMPEAVIGDLDSVGTGHLPGITPERMHRIAEQDSTDFDKALRNIDAPLVIGVGFCGGRLDHQFAAFSTLLEQAARPCILLGSSDIVFHAPPRLQLDLVPDTRVSLMPLVPLGGRSRGLRWPIDGLRLAPGGRLGTSNRATGTVTLDIDGKGMLVVLPRAELGAAVAGLAAAPHPGRQR